MSTTRKQLRDILRSLSSELDNKAVMDSEIDEWINWGQQRVANDLLGAGVLIKNLIKLATPTFTTTAITNVETTSTTIIFTVASHSHVVGDIIIAQGITGTTSVDGVYEVTAQTATTITCPSNLAADTNAETTGWLTNGYCTAETDMMDIPKPIIDLQVKFTASAAVGGADVDYKRATEKLPADFEDMNPYSAHNNTYGIATSTQPIYCIDGNATPAKIIRVYPANVDVAILKYYMRPAAITADATAISIPEEYRDLVLLEIKGKMDFKLKGYEASKVSEVNYQAKLKELLQGSQNKLMATMNERESLSKD